MPDGAYWLWVDRDSGLLTGEGCPAAVQMPFVAGSEPKGRTECLVHREDGRDSIWKKWFGRRKDD